MSFVLSKLFWFVAQPGNVFFLLLLVSLILLGTRWRRGGRRLLVALVVFGLIVSVVPLGRWLTVPLENRFPAVRVPPAQVDGVVVLGGSVNQFVSRARGQVAVGGNVERLLAFSALARRYPDAKLVFSGGSGDLFRQDVKEAEAARKLFAQLGLDIARIRFEDRSRNTAEGARLSHRLIRPKPGERWLLVTSARHMPRAYGTFRRAGWPVTAYPVDYVTDGSYRFGIRFSFAGGLGSLGAGLKEWIGLAYYYLSGRTDALLPGPAR